MTSGSSRASASHGPTTVPEHTALDSLDVPSLENLMELPDMDWIWDVGFPSVIPIDIDSYQIVDEQPDFRD